MVVRLLLGMYPFAVRTLPLLAVGMTSIAIALMPACEPRQKGATGPTATAAVASTPTPAPPPATTATATGAAPTVFTLPGGIAIPGMPASPKAALVGRWNVAAVDGKPVATAPGMATDPSDPVSWVAGSQVTFTADHVTIARAGLQMMSRPYKVVSEIPPLRVTIEAGYGPSNVDFAIDGSCIWSVPTTPPHALSLTRAQ
jgi:hypothetical protein